MASEPIVSNLFRFVTLRNPKLLSNKEKERGFVYFPTAERSNSHFLVDLDTEDDRDERRELLNSRLATYNYMTKRSIVEAVEPTLYEFSDWLMKNKNTLTSDEVLAQSTGVTQLSTNNLVSLWDNLHYQVLTKKSVAVREAIIRMIVADNFLKKNDFEGTKDLISNNDEMRRLANAYVTLDNYIVNNYEFQNHASREPYHNELEILERQLSYFELSKEVEDYNKALTDLKDIIEKVKEENRANYEAAYETYEEDVKQAFKDATESSSSSELAEYGDLTLPTLDFTRKSIFEDGYLESNLEKRSAEIIAYYNFAENKDESILIKRIIEASSEKYQKLLSYKASPKIAFYNGNLIKSDDVDIPLFSYSVGVQRTLSDPTQALVNLILVTGYKYTKATAGSFDITFSDASSITGVTSTFQKPEGKSLIISTYPDTITIPNSATYLEISGSLTLDNGDTIDIDTWHVPLDGTKFGSRGSSQKLAAEKPLLVQYGINKLGVADFTRVEQEVCCYVPGEVSRIENILAKEYRERSTRQLLSTETTIEETTEREVEELTDTSTSERNELSTEVSSILNQDKTKNYGASAGVSGQAFGVEFYADSYLEGSSSSSSSNSSSTTQTYAEEVTRRALERIVQKVTKKRTSRILREFEENNKHGFDNRGGTEHVTGIYRWVDKIYTNRLVNYGKRLMYEFDVPEPSKFFKHAIIQQLEPEEQQGTSPEGLIIPVKPNPPSYYGILNSSSITETNYMGYAARYGALVNPPVDQYIKVGEAFAKDDKTYDSNGYALGKVKVPENYQAYSGTLKAAWGSKANSAWYIHVSLGDKSQWRDEDEGSIYSTFDFSNNFINEVPFAIYSQNVWAGSFNVTLNCERTLESYKKWRDETYNAIIAAYQEKVNAYNDYLNASFIPNPLEPGTTTVEFNPAINRDLEKRELKRLAIEMMARPFNITTAKDNYGGSNSHIWLTNEFDKHSKYVKFFEQAFEWEIMAYIFYPYFYADERNEKWKDLIQQRNDSDPLFQAFLQSGMARMVVPVRPGFEKAVNYFMETGDIMVGDQLAIDRDDDLYLSITEEMEQPSEGVVEKEWETRVPTALTIVQANSAPLNETGLPCCHNSEETDNLAYGSSRMYLEGETPA